jgi:hypothetical protein
MTNNSELFSLKESLQRQMLVPFVASRLIVMSTIDVRPLSDNEQLHDAMLCTIFVDHSQWKAVLLCDEKNALSTYKGSRIFVIIRPDGHNAAISDDAHLDLLMNDAIAVIAK